MVVFNGEHCGVGDLILHAWHAEGYRRAGIPCRFFATRPDKLEVLSMLGQEATDDHTGAIDCGGYATHYNYELRIDKGRNSRAKVWSSQLPDQPAIVRPTVTINAAESEKAAGWVRASCGGKPLALLFPFASYTTRTWPIDHYVRLSELLTAQGFYVCAMGAHGGHRDQLTRFPFFFYGASWNFVAAMMKLASICVGNDSGPAHLSGTLDVPFIAVMGPTKKVFDHAPSVYEVHKSREEIPCAGCHFDATRGFRASCDRMCSALFDIRPQEVADTVAAMKQLDSMFMQSINNA